jgi:hypothetical protein
MLMFEFFGGEDGEEEENVLMHADGEILNNLWRYNR